jgi:hypothetical protein
MLTERSHVRITRDGSLRQLSRDHERMESWTIKHFSQSNPAGTGQDDVPALLRRVADSIESLGTVYFHDADA